MNRKEIARQTAEWFSGSDQIIIKRILYLIFSKPYPTASQEFEALLKCPTFKRALRKFLKQALGSDIEWVLVIPMGRPKSYELIFGKGNRISKNDLFVIWESKNKKRQKIPVLNLATTQRDSDIMSLYEAKNLAQGYAVMTKNIPRRYRQDFCPTIAHIRERLRIFASRNVSSRKFLIKPKHCQIMLGSLNFILHAVKDIAWVSLEDVYDLRYAIRRKDKNNSLKYDPYTVVRDFLRHIKMLPEKRSGTTQKRLRITEDDWDLIRDHIQQDKTGQEGTLKYPEKSSSYQEKEDYICQVIVNIKRIDPATISAHQKKQAGENLKDLF